VRAWSKPGWFALDLRVNGIEFYEVSLRSCAERPTYFEVVIRDRQLGTFALHEGFVLEASEGEDDRKNWRQVSLAELQVAAWEAALRSGCDACHGSSMLESRSEASQSPVEGIFERIPVEGDSSHLNRAGEALRQAGIRFQIVGGLDGRGHRAFHLTLVVSSLLGARVCLRRAGFLENTESKYVHVDSRTGWKVRLLEGEPRGAR
jgi:hypothetical protein